MTVRVLVADDQDLVRTGLSMILDAQPDIDVAGNHRGLDGIVGPWVGQVEREVVFLEDAGALPEVRDRRVPGPLPCDGDFESVLRHRLRRQC